MRHAWALVFLGLAAPARATDTCAPASTLSTCFDAAGADTQLGKRFFLHREVTPLAREDIAMGIGTSLSWRPVRLQTASADPSGTPLSLVEHQTVVTPMLAFGLTDALRLDLGLPVSVYRQGEGLAAVTGGNHPLPRSAVHDARIGLSLSALQLGDIRLAFLWDWVVPTGDETAFAGAPGPTFRPGLAANLDGLTWKLGASATWAIRKPIIYADETVGSELDTSAGVARRLGLLWDVWIGAEARGFVPTTKTERALSERSFSEWLATVSARPDFLGGAGFMLGAGSSVAFGSSSPVRATGLRLVVGLTFLPE